MSDPDMLCWSEMSMSIGVLLLDVGTPFWSDTRRKPTGDSSSTTSTQPRPTAAVCGEACPDAIVDRVVEMVFGLFDLTWVSFGESED